MPTRWWFCSATAAGASGRRRARPSPPGAGPGAWRWPTSTATASLTSSRPTSTTTTSRFSSATDAPVTLVKLYLATSNPGKLRELGALAADEGFELAALPGYDRLPRAPEEDASFALNALEKALHYSRLREGLLVADDSGLVGEGLGGAASATPRCFSPRRSRRRWRSSRSAKRTATATAARPFANYLPTSKRRGKEARRHRGKENKCPCFLASLPLCLFASLPRSAIVSCSIERRRTEYE